MQRLFYNFLFFLCCISVVQAQQKIKTPPLSPLLVSVNLNTEAQEGYFRCYRDQEGKLWLEEKQLQAWGFPSLEKEALVTGQQRYFQLNWYEGLRYVIDEQNLALSIDFPQQWFSSARYEQTQHINTALRPTDPGLFLNYDLTHINNDFSRQNTLSGVTEVGSFTRYGVGSSSFLFNGRNYNYSDTSIARLNTTWTLDQPEKIASWRFGDSITSTLDWSGAARFGGIQYATNFNTQPNLITYPLPGVAGEAVLPSTVDVFVNNAMSYEQEVKRGPFYLNNIPVISGAGTMEIVTRDLMGRQQIAVLPYYASENLLKPGLADYSFELGAIRRNFAIKSNDYGRAVGVGTYSLGFTPWYTAGVHTEILANQQTLGANNTFLMGTYGVFSLGAAASRGNHTNGALLNFGFHRESVATVAMSYGARATLASKNYNQIGTFDCQPYPSRTLQSFISLSTPYFGSIGATLTDVNNGYNYQKKDYFFLQNPDARLLSLNYGNTIFSNAYITLGAIADLKKTHNKQFFASLVIPIDSVTSVSANAAQQNQGPDQQNIQLIRNLPVGDGYGYRLQAGKNGSTNFAGEFAWQNAVGLFGAKYANFDKKNNYELDARGSIIHFGRSTFLARNMEQSFALVQVPGFADVDVYYRNQLVGQTDAKGNFLIPQLLPYQENNIAIEPKDLPLDVTLPDIEKMVVPYYKSGILVQFKVKKTRNLLLTLIQNNQQLVPNGATVFIEGTKQVEYPVGYEGEVFIDDTVGAEQIKGQARWNGHVCHFEMILPKSMEIITKAELNCH